MSTSADMRVAVVIEDDDDIRHLLETVLSQAGFRVVATANGSDGVEAVRANDPVVTTLDVNMPGMDGFEVARRIRAFSPTYIVMLTALNEEIDTLQGLEAGADDYVNKPFRPRELRARIEAMLRRPRVPIEEYPGPATAAPAAPGYGQPVDPYAAPAPVGYPVQPTPPGYPAPSGPPYAQPQQPYPAPAPPQQPAYPQTGAPQQPAGPAYPPQPYAAPPAPAAQEPYGAPPAGARTAAASLPHTGNGWLEHNGLWLNMETRVVQQGTTEIDLTRSEFDLLAALLESGRRVRTKADLVLLLRGESYVTSHFISEADKRAIEVHMGNLRKKLGDNIGSPRWIETVRGVGYRLTAPEE
ncbi:response regulator transcription factor [Galbitalea sp. SE-J8]|uniref:response regulator transcription factor n=1 Tax=Galbitalea sp. SE-J8 TaxID=3054952 RepID=UPI00259C7F77|nr:response regulator transcription factor [Galbitalea sp. SE-J8]MDM4763130.1 response regulator transcription factor [Galbitalea sp. SE-J8]